MRNFRCLSLDDIIAVCSHHVLTLEALQGTLNSVIGALCGPIVAFAMPALAFNITYWYASWALASQARCQELDICVRSARLYTLFGKDLQNLNHGNTGPSVAQATCYMYNIDMQLIEHMLQKRFLYMRLSDMLATLR